MSRKALPVLALLLSLPAAAGPAPAGLTTAGQLLRQVRILHPAQVDPASAVRAREAGLSEERTLALLSEALAPCLSAPGPCSRPAAGAERTRDALLALLGEIGTLRAAPLLWQGEARGLVHGGLALRRLLARGMAARVATAPCAPPGAQEVAAARRRLADFSAVRVRGGGLVAEPLRPEELEDLSYLIAAVDDAAAPTLAPPPPLREVRALRQRGDLDEAARRGAALLTGGRGSVAADGGERRQALEELALAAEVAGRAAQAAALYRGALAAAAESPPGAVCTTSDSMHLVAQVQGLIRAEEQLGRCRASVALRLLGTDEPAPGDHGPRRLARAGFDVARLYRGAMATQGRDAPEAARALQAAGGAIAARLTRQGPEDWERRTLALEGLADTLQRRALPVLLAAAESGTTMVRVRALEAVAALARRPAGDPCDPGNGASEPSSSEWRRPIRPIGHVCGEGLTAPEAAAAAGRVLPFAAAPQPEVRRATAVVLGTLGDRSAVSVLQRLLQDPYRSSGQVCEGSPMKCRQPYPVREAARLALSQLTGKR